MSHPTGSSHTRPPADRGRVNRLKGGNCLRSSRCKCSRLPAEATPGHPPNRSLVRATMQSNWWAHAGDSGQRWDGNGPCAMNSETVRLQRLRVLATGCFMAAQFHDFGCRSAAVHWFRHRAQSGSKDFELTTLIAVIGAYLR